MRTSVHHVLPPSAEISYKMSFDPKSHHTSKTVQGVCGTGPEWPRAATGRAAFAERDVLAPGAYKAEPADAIKTAIRRNGRNFNLSPPARIGEAQITTLSPTRVREGLNRVRHVGTALGLTGGLGVPL